MNASHYAKFRPTERLTFDRKRILSKVSAPAAGEIRASRYFWGGANPAKCQKWLRVSGTQSATGQPPEMQERGILARGGPKRTASRSLGRDAAAPKRRLARCAGSRDHRRRSLYQAPFGRTPPRARNRLSGHALAQRAWYVPRQVIDVTIKRVLPPHGGDVAEGLIVPARQTHRLPRIVAVRLRQMGAPITLCAWWRRRDCWRPCRRSLRAPRRAPAASRRRSRPR